MVRKSGQSKSFIDTSQADVQQRVAALIADIRERCEAAVQKCSAQFDKWEPESFRLPAEEIQRIIGTLDQQVIDDITFVQEQIRNFAQAQRDSMTDIEVETLPGVFLGHKHVPVSSAGAYIPGGKYPLTASAHMTIITAKVAGVPRVIACTPPIRGEIPAATVAAMQPGRRRRDLSAGWGPGGRLDHRSWPPRRARAAARRRSCAAARWRTAG
ncbi:histidinol dehydrogenase [Enemella dayhoffiae]|uniref:histidinol dehydrogenase n=1 Tax=Enemella dayhoffiae TaxID=2016507 RepID=UPI001E61892A|nr:histidinol dehydrogenase [Enemella dayhoffiae]